VTSRLLVGALAACALALAACSDSDNHGGNRPGSQADPAVTRLFDPAGGDALARRALPGVADLPGTGWEVTARDEFDDDDDDIGALFATIPSCGHLADLAFAPGFGGDDDHAPAGRAQVEFSRTTRGSMLPTSVEIEVEIAETVAETQTAWAVVRPLLTSEDTRECFRDLFVAAFAEGDPTGQLKVEMSDDEPLAASPQNGFAIAFGMKVFLGRTELLAGHFEMHFWPYSNAAVTVMIFTGSESLTPAIAAEILRVIDQKVRAAAGS
jgi:hypothetical protein